MGEKGNDKFTGQGFHTWQAKTKGYLMKKQLWSVVKPLGENERIETRQSQAQFQAKDEQALGILLTSLDDHYVHYLDNCNSTHNAWITLERHFGAIAKHSKISLKMQLYGLVMEPGEDLPSLVNRLKSICTQLAYIKSPVDNEDQVAVLLKAVPDEEYGQIVTVLKEKEPIPNLEDVINSLQQHEKKIKVTKNESSGVNGAFIVTSKNNRNNLQCSHCGRTNHLSKDCYEINPCKKCGKINHATKYCRLNQVKASNHKDKYKDRGKGKINMVSCENSSEDDEPPARFEYTDVL